MGSYITRLRWGGDPDTPNDFSGLTLRDIYNVQTTWAPVYAQSGTYGMTLFLTLFKLNPETQNFFKAITHLSDENISKSYQFKAHVRNLMSSINTAVENLKEPEVVAALMNKLGESHYSMHVQQKHFEEFKEIWKDVLKNDFKLNEQLMDSWDKFIDFIYKHIFEKLCVNTLLAG